MNPVAAASVAVPVCVAAVSTGAAGAVSRSTATDFSFGTTVVLPPLKRDAQVIGMVAVAHGVSHFFHLILAPLFPWLQQDFDFSYARLGLLMTGFFAVSGVGQALAGFVVDRIGARPVLFFGLACLSAAALLLASAQGFAMLLAGSMLAGLGNSVFHPSDYTLLNRLVSPARLGHAFSVHGISGNLGWAAAPVFLAGIAGLAGWRAALLAAALLPAAVLAVLIVLRARLQTGPSGRAVQADEKGAGNQLESRRKNFGAATAAGSPPAGGMLDFLRLPAIWMCFGFFIISACAFGGVQSFAAISLRSLYGFSLLAATSAYTAYMLSSAVGTLAGGFLASRTNRHDRTIALAFSAAGCMALLIASGMAPGWVPVMLMGGMGFGAGIAAPSRDLLIRAAAPANATGRVYGVVYSGFDIGLSVAPLFFGALMDAQRPAAVFVWIGIFQVLAIATAITVGKKTAALRTLV